MMIKNRLTDEDKKFIRDNRNELTPAKMALIIGFHKDAIYRYFKKCGFSVHKEKKGSVWYLKEPKKSA